MRRLPPLALQVEAAHRVAALLGGHVLRSLIPEPHITIEPHGRVELTFHSGDWDADLRAVDTLARLLKLCVPLWRPDQLVYRTDSKEWIIQALRDTPLPLDTPLLSPRTAARARALINGAPCP